MGKKKSKNAELTITAISDFIFRSAEGSIIDFKQKEELRDISKEFNTQPFLKRFLDFSVLYFWAATTSCNLYYDYDHFLKICDGIQENIFTRFSEIEKEQKIFGVVLKDYVKDKDELAIFYRNYPVGDETVIGFRALLDLIITKRFFDYNSVLSLDLSQQVQKVPFYFCKHIFGKEGEENEIMKRFLMQAMFSICISSFEFACTKLVTEIEERYNED